MLCFLRSGAVGVLSGKPHRCRACFTHMYAKINNRRSIKGDVSKEEVLLLHQTLVREPFYCENPQHRQNVTSRAPLVTQEMIQVEGVETFPATLALNHRLWIGSSFLDAFAKQDAFLLFKSLFLRLRSMIVRWISMSFVVVRFYHAIFDLIYFMHACDEGRVQIMNDGLFTFACKMFCIFELRSESESVS